MTQTRKSGLFGVNDDFNEEFLSLDDLVIKHQAATFFFRASTNQHAPEIKHGDILIVDRSCSPRSGDYVILHHNGERSCQRWPYHPQGEIEIFGVVTANLRLMRSC